MARIDKGDQGDSMIPRNAFDKVENSDTCSTIGRIWQPIRDNQDVHFCLPIGLEAAIFAYPLITSKISPKGEGN